MGGVSLRWRGWDQVEIYVRRWDWVGWEGGLNQGGGLGVVFLYVCVLAVQSDECGMVCGCNHFTSLSRDSKRITRRPFHLMHTYTPLLPWHMVHSTELAL